MQKGKTYHEEAVIYNKELADFAEELSKRLEHETIKHWCTVVWKQHRFHERRHTAALAKLETDKGYAQEDTTPDEPEVHVAEPTLEDEQAAFAAEYEQREVARDAGSGQFVSHEYAEENPETTVVETVEVKVDHVHGTNIPCGPGCPAYNEDGVVA